MKTRNLALLGATFLLCTSLANASVVPGQLLGVFTGNDTTAGILDNLGLTVELLARVETPSSIDADSLTNDGLTISDFTLQDNGNVEAIAGQWSYAGPEIANLIVLKANGKYAVYLFTDAITNNMPNIGLWDTSDLHDKGLSHITAYHLIPVPGAVWLLGSALFGLLVVRRR